MHTIPNGVRVLARLAFTVALAVPLYLAGYRPLQLHWGATDAELAQVLPGDELAPRPIFNATRAVTIDASPAAIWPWLVQIGYGRAGWYSALGGWARLHVTAMPPTWPASPTTCTWPASRPANCSSIRWPGPG